MASPFVLILEGVVSTYIVLRLLLHYTQDAKEPPAIQTSIPFIGPIIGMIMKKTHYYTHNRDKYGLPIYTLRIPGSRLYVVNSTALITAVQRQFLTLAFAPIETRAAINVMGATEEGKVMLMKNLDPKTGDWEKNYAVSYRNAIHPAMSPGPSLDAMNRAAVQKVTESLDVLKSKTPKTVRMFEWIRHEITLATSDSVYGPQNPFRDSGIEAAFWRFGPGVVTLIVGILPSILAKESLKARELLITAFEQYFKNGGEKQASALVKARCDHNAAYDVSLSDLARFEIGGAVAILGNTGPAGFWLTYHIFSDPNVLADIRNEVAKIVKSGANGRIVDITDIKTSCPILLSTLQEVLRFHSIGTSVRIVMEDHLLDGKYLLKKGNTVMIPGTVQHTLPSIWGEKVAEFDHRRFLRSGNSKRPNPVAFRGFGGGTTLCPGRHFASTEILAFAALMALRFDIAPVSGKWVRPTTENAEMWATVPQPDKDIDVAITPRTGGELEKELTVVFLGSDKAMEI